MTPFASAFSEVPDPRTKSLVDHPFLTVLAIVVLSTICGAEGWEDMECWATAKLPWLETFLDLSHGVPSADTIRRVMGTVLPGPFRKAFTTWAHHLAECMNQQVIAIDGKTARGSRKPSQDIAAVHVVRAFVAANRIVLGQVAVEAKSNELTAIPRLLSTLAIQGGMVTIDAMGTHKNIAQAILDKQADFLLPVKDNQPKLRHELEQVFEGKTEPSRNGRTFFRRAEKGHGRLEERKVWVHTNLDALAVVGTWPGVKTLIHIESHRKVGDNESSIEHRYYISSALLTAQQAAGNTRSHWSVENPCHWILDVVFQEDRCPIHDGYAAENLSLIRSVALNALRQTPQRFKKTMSLRQKRKMCGWDADYLNLVARSLF
jgi:predicted transposase YbfD/YdcC